MENTKVEETENITMEIENADEVEENEDENENEDEDGEEVRIDNEIEDKSITIKGSTLIEVPIKLILVYKEIIEVMAKRKAFVKEETDVINNVYRDTIVILQKNIISQ